MKKLFTLFALMCLMVSGAWAQLPEESGVYQIQNISGEGSVTGRGYLIDYTSWANGPSIGNCPWSTYRDKHPVNENDNVATCSLWYVYKDTDGYYIFSLSTLNNKKDPRFLNVGTSKNATTYSASKVLLDIVTNSSNSSAVSIKNHTSSDGTNYLAMGCGYTSGSQAVVMSDGMSDGGTKLSFIPCANTLTDSQKLLIKKGISLIVTSPFDANKVYTIDNTDFGKRGKLAYNPVGGNNVGLADVSYNTQYANLHAKTTDSSVGINWSIIQGTNGLYTLKCTKNDKYITGTSKAIWGTTATEFYCIDNSGSYSFVQKGTDNYLTASCGWAPASSEGPVQIRTYEENACEFKIAEGEEIQVTYTITITGAPDEDDVKLYYKGEPCGQTLEASNIKKEDFTATQIPGYTYTITINETEKTITVTYTAGKYKFEDLHVNGLPERFQRVVEINGVCYTKSEIESAKPVFDGPNVQPVEIPGYTASMSFTDKAITVTYTAVNPLDFDLNTDYYVTIKGPNGYIYYSESDNTINYEGSSRSLSNRAAWRLSIESGTKTLTNGQSGQTLTFDDSWEYEAVPFQIVAKVNVNEDDGKGYAVLGTDKAYNNGFLFATNEAFPGLTYGNLTSFGKVGAGVENHGQNDNPSIAITYYTQEQAEVGVKELTYRMVDWYNHIDMTGYQTMESLGIYFTEDGQLDLEKTTQSGVELYENVFTMLYFADLSMDENGVIPYFISPEYYITALNAFNNACASRDIVLPKVGEAYKLSVRTKDYFKENAQGAYVVHRKYLKADGTLTENKEEASVFVLGEAGENFLFASNDNTEINYLTAEGEKTTDYDASTCAFTYGQMSSLSANDNIVTDPNDRIGTFFLVINGKVVTANGADNTWTWTDEKDVPYMNDNYTSCIEMEDVDYPYNKVTMTAGNDRVKYTGSFATIYLPFPMTMPAGVEVYEGTEEKLCHVTKGLNADGQKVDLNEDITFLRLNCIKDNTAAAYIPAGAYILYSENAGEGNFTSLPAPAAGEELAQTGDKNVFVGSTENPEVYAHKGIWGEPIEGDTDLWSTFLSNNIGTPYVLGNKSKTNVTDDYAVTGIGFYEYKGDTYPKGKAIYMKDSTTPAKSLKLDFGGIVTAIEALHGNTTSAEIYDLQGRRLDKVQKGQINVINGQKVMFN